MFTTWIRRQLSRRIIGSTVIVLAAWLIGLGIFGSLLIHGAFGTDPLEGAAAVAALQSADAAEDYVDVSGDATIDTGVERVTQNSSGEVQSTDFRIVALTVADSIVLVKVNEATDATRFRGRTEPVDNALFDRVTEDVDPEVRSMILPVTIDATTDWRLQSTVILAIMAVATVAAIVLGIRWFRQIRRPSSVKALAGAADAEALLAEIDADLAGPTTLVGKNAAVGSRFLATKKAKVTPLGDIVWVYTKVTQQKVYGVVPAGKNTSTIVALANGKELTIPVTKKDLITPEHLAPRLPWSFIGYSADRAAAWKHAGGREQMVSASASRRDATLAPTPPSGFAPSHGALSALGSVAPGPVAPGPVAPSSVPPPDAPHS